MKTKPQMTVQMKSKTEVDVTIFDTIGDGFWGGTSPKSIVDAIKAVPDATQINVSINSPGGSVFDGVTIYNILQQHKANVTVNVEGLAASAASLVAMAGDEIIIAENAMMMIHDPWTFTAGSAPELRKEADLLDKIGGTLVGTYAARTGLSVDEVAEMMAAETWMTADEAVNLGFATETVEAKKVAALIDPQLAARYKNAPDAIGSASADQPPGLLNKAAAWLGLKDKPAGQPQRKEPAMATKDGIAPDGAAPESITPQQRAEIANTASKNALADERKRIVPIRRELAAYPKIIEAAEESDITLVEAKAMGFDAAQLQIVALETKLAEAMKLVEAAGQAGVAPVDTGDEPEDPPEAYDAAFAVHVAAGKSEDEARCLLARSDPEGHAAWLAKKQKEIPTA